MKRGWVIGIIIFAVVMVAGVVVMSITRWGWAWTGVVEEVGPNQEYFRGKTLWDLLELLIVPAVLALTALWFSNRERKDDREAADQRAELDRGFAEKRAQTEREIATDRLQEAALQTYYDKMTELLLEKNLREAKAGEEVISIANSRTLATLRSLDGNRKGMLIKFLCEVKLIEKEQTIIDLNEADLANAELGFADLRNKNLRGARMGKAYLYHACLRQADLSGASLSEAVLSEADLNGTDLSGANLNRANLSWAILRGAFLSWANLTDADLSKADLNEADLSGADLNWANLSEADLSKADLSRADLSGADLSGADLSGADLSGATLSGADLSGATLRGATLNGADLIGAKLDQTIELSSEQLAAVKTLYRAQMQDGSVYDPAIHTEIAQLRKEAGLDDGNTPPENS